MRQNDKLSQRQLMAMAFIGLLAPSIRLLPVNPVRIAGNVAWVSAIAAIIPAILYLAFLAAFLKNRGEDEGLSHMLMRSLGKTGGKAVSFLFALWLIVYSGFILRTAAERLVSAVYKNGNIALFLVIILVIILIASLGRLRYLSRTAEVFLPILLIVLVFVIAFSFSDVKIENLLPVSYLDTKEILLGVIPIINVISGFTYFAFLSGHVRKDAQNPAVTRKWVLILLLCIFFIIITSIGVMSAPLVAKLQNPFFTMIRNVTIFGVVERIEAVVVMLWGITDFVYLSSLFMVITEILKSVFNTKSRKGFVWPVGAIVLVCSFVIVGNAFNLQVLSEWIMPAVNMSLVFILLPVIFLIGKARKKI